MEQFRLGRPEEADGIFAMYRAAAVRGRENGSSAWDDDYPDLRTLQEDLAQGRLLVLEEGGAILACVSLLESEEPETEGLSWTPARACFPARLCVDPDRQGEGLGERVMRHLADHARAEGLGSIRLLAAVANPAANRLYERLGYRRTGLITLYGLEFSGYERLVR